MKRAICIFIILNILALGVFADAVYYENQYGGYDYDAQYYSGDGYYYSGGEDMGIGAKVLISIAVGAVIAFIAVGIMKSKMKSVRSQSAAGDYIRGGSFKLTESREIFLYRHISKTPRPQNNSRGSGRGPRRF